MVLFFIEKVIISSTIFTELSFNFTLSINVGGVEDEENGL